MRRRIGEVTRAKRSITTSKFVANEKDDGDVHFVYGGIDHPYGVVNKPPGLVVMHHHSLGEDSIKIRLRKKLDELGRTDVPVLFPHRIDSNTQGLVIVCFDKDIVAKMNHHIYHHLWDKRYRAIASLPTFLQPEGIDRNEELKMQKCWRSPHLLSTLFSPSMKLMDHVIIRSFLERTPTRLNYSARHSLSNHVPTLTPPALERDYPFTNAPSTISVMPIEKLNNIFPTITKSPQFCSVPNSIGRISVTEVWLQSINWKERLAYYDIKLHTGRTHQIRVHFYENGMPLVNDTFYQPFSLVHSIEPGRVRPNSGNLGLQACKLKLLCPLTEQIISFELAPPKDWYL